MSEEKINWAQTAELLGISQATIRNWIRHGYLGPVDDKGKQFLKIDILNLKEALAAGKIDRLRRRANKAQAAKTFLPVEYLKNEDNILLLNRLSEYIKEQGINIKMAIFLLALNLFSRSGDLQVSSSKELSPLRLEHFCRRAVYAEMYDFIREIDQEQLEEIDWASLISSKDLEYLWCYPLPEERDVLGVIYQSLLQEGRKARLGSYFTPPELVLGMVSDTLLPRQKVLDPCCGTGQFLLACADYLEEPRNLFGLDIDGLAVRIARINLLLKYPQDFSPQVYVLNTLKDLANQPQAEHDYRGYFDLLITNPPWGAGIEKAVAAKLKAEFPGISSGESFTYFLLISLKLLKDGGTLSFILPESILHIHRHADIRKYILENCRIKRIDCLGKKFQNVLSSVIRLDLQQRKPDGREMVMIRRPGAQYHVAQNRFSRNKGFVFDVYLTSQDEIMLGKVYETKHITLEGKADWALGIVTGDNGRFLLAEPAAGCEPIYKGSDVSAFRLKKASTYIQFRPELFQQVAPVHKYRAKEKLIYKFISRTPVLAYDDQGSLTLNSANILIPKVNYPLKAILALFNSSLYAFIYQKKFHALKILRGDLEQLPLPLWNSTVLDNIVNLVDKVLKEEEDFSDLDNYILEQFKFTPEEKEYIRAAVKAGNE